tara:strand:+ start:830 stop:1606 length:777 start_codon:yes stop_codon:yes gene_type:complete
MDLLNKAQRLLEKAEELDMVEHEGEDVPAFAVDGKGPKDKKKDKKRPSEEEESEEEDEGPEDDGDDDIKLEKGKKCAECGKPMNKGACMKMGCGAKMQKAEGHEAKIVECLKKKGGAASLKECADACGVSTSECKKMIDKMSNVKMSPHGDVILMDGLQKAEPGFSTTFGFEPQGIMFASESGGQTRNAYYSTNQYLINSQDVANKGGQSSSVNFDGLSGQLNPHDGGGVDRQVQGETLTKQQITKIRDVVRKSGFQG